MASKESLVLDYYHTTLYPSEYEKTVENGGYIKMPYIHSSKGPNLVYNGRKYTTSQLYITKVSDNEGELVIKHVPTTNGENPVYLIIPLKTRPTTYEETAIDKIIYGKSSISFHLGELIGYNTSASVNKDRTIFKLSPILVKSSFDTFVAKKMEWDNTKEDDFRKINLLLSHTHAVDKDDDMDGVEGFTVKTQNIIEGNQNIIEGNDSSDSSSYLTCEPILENDGKLQKTVEYMPVTSELAKKMGTMNAATTIVNFMIFILIIVIASLITPAAYKILFVDYTMKLNPPLPQNKYATLKILDSIWFIILLAFSVGIAATGASINDALQTMIGSLMTILLIVCTAVMAYFKMESPEKYSLSQDVDVDNIDYWENIMLFIGLIGKRLKYGGGPGYVSMGIGASAMIGLFMYFFKKFDKNKKKDKTKKNMVLWYFLIFGTVITIYLVSRFNNIIPESSGRVAPI